MMERQRPQSKVSLEDLLRLKRAERPAPEFWAEFEDQLRRKQLAAIVDKRPWWRRLSTASLARISIPVGATAIIAFTVVSVRERLQSTPLIPAAAETMADSQSVVSGPSIAEAKDPSSAENAGASMMDTARPADAPATNDSSLAKASSHLAASDQRASESGGMVIAQATDAPEASLAQVILGLEGATESDARPYYQAEAISLLNSMDVLGEGHTQSVSALESAQRSQASSPRDDRRARLLASLDSQDRDDLISGNSRVARSRDRITSRLNERALSDSISRLGVSGDSVSIKF